MSKVNLGVNWVRDLWYDPCDPDPWILLELAFPAVIQAIWEYVQWDWEDYVEVATGKPWQKHLKKKIKANKWQPPKAMSRGVLFLFIAEAGVQRLAWMFLVAEIIANAFIRWSSLLASLPECNEEVTSAWGRSESPLDGRPLNYSWMSGPEWATEAGNIFPYVPSKFTIPAGGAAYYATFQRYAAFISGTELKVVTRLIRVHDGKVLNSAPPNDPDDPKNRSSAMYGKVRNTDGEDRTYEFQVMLLPGQTPLVWHCVGDFVSLRIFEPSAMMPTISLPYIPLPQPDRRHTPRRRRRGASD